MSRDWQLLMYSITVLARVFEATTYPCHWCADVFRVEGDMIYLDDCVFFFFRESCYVNCCKIVTTAYRVIDNLCNI